MLWPIRWLVWAAIRLLLHLGLYQLFWLQRVPDHAAVHETVELAKLMGFGHQAGFVNAVLRGYVRERAETEQALEQLKRTDPPAGYSHPAWLVDRWQARWGAAATEQLLRWNNSPPPVYARLNRLKTDVTGLTTAWKEEGVEFEERKWDWTEPFAVFELKSHPTLVQLESFKRGYFYLQDPSTLLAVNELGARPGETILDLCAAPGGKTTAIAEQMQNRGRLAARDSQPDRLKLVRENCERLGVTCVDYPQAAEPGQFDRILIDAPCSNTGVLRRRVDLRWRIQPGEIESLSRTQQSLLTQAAAQLKSGSTIVYSTCSLEPEENQSVTQEFLRQHPSFKLDHERQLLPTSDAVDGAYVAGLSLK